MRVLHCISLKLTLHGAKIKGDHRTRLMGVVEFTTMGADPSPGKSSARNPAAWLRLGRGLSTIIGLMDPRAFGLELGTDALATAFDGIVHHLSERLPCPQAASARQARAILSKTVVPDR
jgi:hypothetical protein